MHRLSKRSYLGSIAFAVPLALALLVGFMVTGISLFGLAAILCLLYFGGVIVSLWYKAWAAIQDSEARTTPGRAILFMFIPVFNVYWAFQLIWGFAQDYNAYIRRHHVEAKPLSAGLFLFLTLLFLVLSAISGLVGNENVPESVSFVIWIIVLITGLVGHFLAANQVCDAVNAIPREDPLPTLFGTLSVLAIVAVIMVTLA